MNRVKGWTADQEPSLRAFQETTDAHRKNPGTCSIKGYTVHSREMSQDPPVHLHVLIIADGVDRAEALSSCELSASAHLHYNHREEIHSNHSTFHFCLPGQKSKYIQQGSGMARSQSERKVMLWKVYHLTSTFMA